MEARPHLSVVIPAYNEQERLKRFVPGIVKFLQSKGWPFEIIVVNDGSRDGSRSGAQSGARYRRTRSRAVGGGASLYSRRHLGLTGTVPGRGGGALVEKSP